MNIPFLIYHNVTKNDDGNKYTLKVVDLERQFRYLSSNSFKSLVINDASDIDKVEGKTNNRLAGITFDDGYESSLSIVLPLLKKYSLKATFFITTDWIGNDDYMNWGQLKKLKEEGMSIQSHCKSHRFLDDLTVDDIEYELDQSRKVLEGELGVKVNSFSCPGGRFNSNVIKIAKNLNYNAMYSSQPFFFNKSENQKKQEFLIIGRNNINQLTTFSKYRKIIEARYSYTIRTKAAYSGKKIIKSVLGNRGYYFIWKKLMKKETSDW